MAPTLEFDPETDVPDRAAIPEKYRWDRSIVFPSEDAWEQELEALDGDIDELGEYRGRIEDGNGEALLGALETYHDLKRRRGRLWIHAKLRVLADTTDDDARTAMGRFKRVNDRIDDAASFIEPNVQSLGRERIGTMVEGYEGLDTYDRYLDKILDRAEHTRSPAVESVLADLEHPLASPARVLRELKNADFEPPTVETPEGDSATVTSHTYGRLLERDDRAFRRRVHEAYVGELERHRAASARAFADRIEATVRLARIRNYESTLDARLKDEFPVASYEAVVEGLRDDLEPFHRHLALYDRRTDGDDLRLWDVHVPLGDERDGHEGGDGGDGPTIPYGEAREIAVEAVAPLGESYQERLESFLVDRRVDVYETETKRSDVRAMNVPTYGVGSFVLLNYKRDLRSLYYFVHELGHAMHASHYRDQPTVYEDYPDHIVEIPSFVHEALLTAYLLEEYADDERERRHVLATAVEKLPLRIGAHWSAFVREAHEVAEEGDQLTADRFDDLYGSLQAEFLAPVALQEGDERYWLNQDLSRPPYFSYLYLVGICGGLTVADRLLSATSTDECERYRNFLRAGTSRSPTDLLALLDLDFRSGRPVERALKTYEEYVAELEDAI